jgi:4a-hydroxytetrahydrobiopterin dehydratase
MVWPMPDRLSPADLADALAQLPDVGHEPVGQLQIRLQLPSFAAAAELIARVAAAAEELDHHPDVDLRWRTVTFGLSTHSAGGVTSLDLALARTILDLGARLGAEPLDPPSRRPE